MSWEEGPTILCSCPCGSGQYAVVSRSDDWGRYEDRWKMLCPSCQAQYGLYSFEINCKGIVGTDHAWVPRQLLMELKEGESELQRAKEMLSNYASLKYRELWSRHFLGKTKKAIWQELTRDGGEYPSLSSFYLQIRQCGLAQQLGRYFDCRYLPTVVRVLKLDDSELKARIEQVQQLECELEIKHSHARQQRNTAVHVKI